MIDIRSPFFLVAAVAFAVLPARCARAAVLGSSGPVVSSMSGGGGYVVNYASNGTPIASAVRSIGAGAATGEALIMDSFVLSGPAGKALPVTASRAVSAANVARALAATAGRMLPILGVGMLGYELIQGIRCKSDGIGSLLCDSGQSPENIQVVRYSIAPLTGTFDTKAAACSAFVKYHDDQDNTTYHHPQPGNYYNYTLPRFEGVIDPNGITCRVNVYDTYDGSLAYSSFRKGDIFSSTVQSIQCPPLPPELAAVASTGSLDQKCPTGKFDPATEQQVADKLAPHVPSSKAPGIVQQAVDNKVPVTVSDSQSLSGPASQQAQPKTETITGPSGTTSTTTNTTYNYTYQGDNITYTTSSNTTVNNTNPTTGETTTTTTTESGTPPEKPTDLCALHPEALACAKLGDTEAGPDIPIHKVPITPTRDGRFGAGGAGSCPTRMVTFSVAGGVSFNFWQPFCDFAQILRGVILSMFSLASAVLFGRGVRN